MNHQQGSMHTVVIIGLVIALIGSLGFIFWQNFVRDDGVSSTTETSEQATVNDTANDQTDDISAISEASKQEVTMIINSREVIVDVSDAEYDDITAEFDNNKGYYDVYSKDLKARLDAYSAQHAPTMKGCNSTVVVDTYSADDVSGQYNKVGEVNGKFVHTGLLGPCDPSGDSALSNEMFRFRDYFVEKMKATLQ